MAEKPKEDKIVFPEGSKFYRESEDAGLKVIIGEPLPGEVQPERIAFSPFLERIDGDNWYAGYYTTNNKKIQERLAEIASVQEIDEEQFVKATTAPGVHPLPV